MNIDCHIKNTLCKKRIVCFQWLIIFLHSTIGIYPGCSAFVLAEWFVPDSFYLLGVYIYTVHWSWGDIHKLITFTYRSWMFNAKRFSCRISLTLNHFPQKYSLTLNYIAKRMLNVKLSIPMGHGPAGGIPYVYMPIDREGYFWAVNHFVILVVNTCTINGQWYN